ncbi:MAG TPA: hypothetical protein RMH99_14885 [Sandaracinaceae bacterium LLY-WYZ-13_1]|nr:hypothetical protein [Sandaracinaceae bacterium LLY-WYZ-13_1]
MSEEEEKEPAFGKGDRVAIVDGPKDVGVRGQVFWVGENKFGPGMRFGIRGDDGATYWANEGEVGPEEGAPPPPKPMEPGPALERGTRVKITGGPQGAGEEGEIFWAGESKFGPGMRYGIRGEGEETWWVDGGHVEALEEPPAKDAGPSSDGAGAAPADAPPMPDPDEFQDFAEEAPPDDAPFPDDVPF